MKYSCIINDINGFDLVRWDRNEFRDSLNLVLQSIDLAEVKRVCQNVDRIDIYQDDNLIATYTCFDTFDSINYLGQMYVAHEQKFADALSVVFNKANICEQVQRLDNQLNPVIDTESMTLDQYKNYKLEILSRECSSSIYKGGHVVLSDGSVETFSFTANDQADLQSLSSIAMMDPTIELTWHSDGNPCRFYSAIDIILIYQTLNMKLFREVTICNAINLLIKQAGTKEEVDQYYWGCDLPQEDQTRVSNLISRMSAIVQELINKLIPSDDSNTDNGDGNEDDGEDNGENGNGENSGTDSDDTLGDDEPEENE